MNVRGQPRQPQCSKPSSPASESASPVVARADVARPGSLGRTLDCEPGRADPGCSNVAWFAGATARSVSERMPSGSASARWKSGFTLSASVRGMRLPTDEYHSSCCVLIFLRRLPPDRRPRLCWGGSESAASIARVPALRRLTCRHAQRLRPGNSIVWVLQYSVPGTCRLLQCKLCARRIRSICRYTAP